MYKYTPICGGLYNTLLIKYIQLSDQQNAICFVLVDYYEIASLVHFHESAYM